MNIHQSKERDSMANNINKKQVRQMLDQLIVLLEEMLTDETSISEDKINTADGIYKEIERKLEVQTKNLLELMFQAIEEIFEQKGNGSKNHDMNKVFIAFGTLIKKYRVSKNLSIAELSQASGISPGYLSNLERGRVTNVAFCVINSIVRALEIPKNEVLKTLTWDNLPD